MSSIPEATRPPSSSTTDDVDIFDDPNIGCNKIFCRKFFMPSNLKYTYFLIGGFVFFLFTLSSNLVFLVNIPKLQRNWISVTTLLQTCCSNTNPSFNTSSGCCPSNFPECCECSGWLPDPTYSKNGNCQQINDPNSTWNNCTSYFDIITGSPTNWCQSDSIQNWNCPNSDCLTDPPACYALFPAWFFTLVSEFLMILCFFYSERIYYTQCFLTGNFKERETKLAWYYRLKKKFRI